MPPSELPDYRTPSPDQGHEAIRAPLARAIDDLARVVEDSTTNQAGVQDAYFLTDALFELLGYALTAVDELSARVDALEIPPPPPAPDSDPIPDGDAPPTDPTPEVAP